MMDILNNLAVLAMPVHACGFRKRRWARGTVRHLTHVAWVQTFATLRIPKLVAPSVAKNLSTMNGV